MNAWNRPLTNLEVQQFTDGCFNEFVAQSKPNIIRWPQINNSSIGEHVHFETIPNSAICPHNNEPGQVSTRIMNYRLSFNKSRSLCTRLGGKMPLISNESEFLTFSGNNFSSQIPVECDETFWLPIMQSRSDKTVWLDARNETILESPVSFMPWAAGQPNGN